MARYCEAREGRYSFPRISYDEAVKMRIFLEGHAKGALIEFEYGGDFGSPDETYLPRCSTPGDGASVSGEGESVYRT